MTEQSDNFGSDNRHFNIVTIYYGLLSTAALDTVNSNNNCP